MASNYSLNVVSGRDGTRSSYYQHDDRETSDHGRSGFNRGGSGGRRRGRNHNNRGNSGGSRYHTDVDGDIAMDDGSHGPYSNNLRRNAPYSKGGRRRHNDRGGPSSSYSQDNRRRGNPSGGNRNADDTWSKIVIPNGRQHDKNFILKSITDMCEVPFFPIHYHNDGRAAVFFVESRFVSLAIGRLHKKITLPDGYMMSLIVRSCPAPTVPLDKYAISKLKDCMNSRFNPDSKALNLSDLGSDAGLRNEGFYLPLSRNVVLNCVVDIIIDSVPELYGLDLSKNGIRTLDGLERLSKKMKQLKVLHLGQNMISKQNEMEKITGLALEELVLIRNPIRDNFKDQETYISFMRQKFPKLLKLDNTELPPPIGFDIEGVVLLPTSQGCFFVHEEAKKIVIQFLELYFSIYDSNNRRQLTDAYHENAVLSLSCSKISPKALSLADYMSCNRNLLRVSDKELRNKMLYKGKEGIVGFLSSLPSTKHDPSSFSIDLPYVSPNFLTFTISGIFKESDGKRPVIRSFSRTFIVTRFGTGYCILNEMYFISNPTNEQLKNAFKTPAPTPSSSPVPQLANLTIGPSTSSSSTSGEFMQQQQMVEMFSQHSGMNYDWSLKCLQDNEWNLEKAAQVFSQIHAQGNIPPEAFIKIS